MHPWLAETQGQTCGNATASACNSLDMCNGQGSCPPNFVFDMTECKLSKDVWDPADVCQSAICVEAFAAAGDACGSSPLGDCALPDTCHGACADRVMDVSIVCCPADMEWDGSHDCLADFFVVERTDCGSDVDTDCDNPDTCEGMRVHPLYV